MKIEFGENLTAKTFDEINQLLGFADIIFVQTPYGKLEANRGAVIRLLREYTGGVAYTLLKQSFSNTLIIL